MNVRRVAGALLTAVFAAAAGAVLSAPSATARTLPLFHDFGTLMPGQTQSHSHEIDLDAPATVQEAAFTAQGDARWLARLCHIEEHCVPLTELRGRELQAGSYFVVIDITMHDTTTAGSAFAEGQITLLQTGGVEADALPSTGGGLPSAAMIAAGAFLGGGAILLMAARRRREPQKAKVRR